MSRSPFLSTKDALRAFYFAKRRVKSRLKTLKPTFDKKVLNIIATVALTFNVLGSSLTYVFANYEDQLARTPQALASNTAPTSAPAADNPATSPATALNPTSTSPAQAAELASEKAGATAGNKKDLTHVQTLSDNRTAQDTVYLNKDGSKSLVHTFGPSNYKDSSGNWQTIDSSLTQDSTDNRWKTKANDWQAQLGGTLSDGVHITRNGQDFVFHPVGANNVTPTVTGTGSNQLITYKEVWQGIDLQYRINSDQVQEMIVIHSKVAQSAFDFDTSGANLTPDSANPGGFTLNGQLSGFEVVAPNVATYTQGVIEGAPLVTQTLSGNRIHVQLDASWLASQSDAAFPVTVDPSVVNGIGSNYWNYKSDGYYCAAGAGCGNSTGNASGNYWQSIFQAPLTAAIGHYVNAANLSVVMYAPQQGQYYGVTTNHNIYLQHATCFGYNCGSNNYGTTVGTVGSSGVVDATQQYRTAVELDDTGACMVMIGDQIPGTESYKMFDPTQTAVTINFENLPVASTTIAPSPANGGVSVTTQPTLAGTNTWDSTSSGPYLYRFIVGTGTVGNSDPWYGTAQTVTGVVSDSGLNVVPKATVPNNVLQDGQTYYWQIAVNDSYPNAPDVYGPVYSFKVDLRNGKSNTQEQDTVGPVSVDFATGNVSTSQSSHTMNALAGSMGVSFDYNSPERSEPGLIGQYWNVSSGQTTIPTGVSPNLTETDPSLDFNWGSNANFGPYPGLITQSWWVGEWTGYILVPVTGSYQFGLSADDNATVKINGTAVTQTPSAGQVKYYGSSVSLTANVPTPIEVDYNQATGQANLNLYAKGPVEEQIVPNTWLQTGVEPIATPHGLLGQYFTDPGTHNFPSDNQTGKFLTRTDTSMNLNWSSGSPVPNGPTQHYLVKWIGYITPPVNDTYTFGAQASDGVKITVNNNTVLTSWQDQTMTSPSYGSGITLSGGVQYPIEIDYYKDTGPSQMSFYAKQQSLGNTGNIVSSSWLSPNAQVLPVGWGLGTDASGSVSYDYAVIGQNAVTLHDSTGLTHQYTYNSQGGFTPPVNEDGHMVRNADGTITFQDSDGRTYIFYSDGTLKSTSTPVDDAHPAALQYVYGGTPAHLTQILDGVNSSRYMNVYYSGDSNCPSEQSGFYQPPAGMICAVTSSDGNTTQLSYDSNGRLARIIKPGGETYDYGYDSLGRILTLRDSLAYDAISAGVQANDNTALTAVAYDSIGRASSVTMPAATAGATQQEHTYSYALAQNYSVQFGRWLSATDNAGFTPTPTLSGYFLNFWQGYIENTSLPNTVPLYSCLVNGTDEMTSLYSNCQGATLLGQDGYIYSSLPSGVAGSALWLCHIPSSGDHFNSTASNCEGQSVDYLLGYLTNSPLTGSQGYTQMHVSGAEEPQGYTRQVTYDNTYRTVADSSPTGCDQNGKQSLTGDFNGDGKQDLAIICSLPNARTIILLSFGDGAGHLGEPAVAYDSGVNGFDSSTTQFVSGDFNSDGKTDIAAFEDVGNSESKIYVFSSQGTTFSSPAQVWDSGAGSWNQANTKIVAGDFNGDGKTDIMAFYDYGSGLTRSWLFAGNGTGGFASPTVWWNSGVGNWVWGDSKFVATDVNHDGKTDVVALYNYGNANTSAFLFTSGGSGWGNIASEWNSGAGNWDWNNSKLIAGDFNGDGYGDIAVLYNYGNQETKLWVFLATSSNTLSTPTSWYDTGTNFRDWNNMSPAAEDLNSDGKADFVSYNNGNGTADSDVTAAISTGSAFNTETSLLDATKLTTTTNWDPVKDIVLSTVDPSELESTTLYDYNERPTDQYGPAPSAWFDNTTTDSTFDQPLSSYTSQVPHTQIAYDGGIPGIAVSYYDVTQVTTDATTGATTRELWGNPKAHTTGIGPSSGDVVSPAGWTPPGTYDSGDGWGARLTGYIYLANASSTNNVYSFRIHANDGVNLYIDDNPVAGNWTDTSTARDSSGSYTNPTAGWHRIRLDYYNQPSAPTSVLDLYMTPEGGTETSALGSLLTPDYGLTTSETTNDSSSSVGNETQNTNYGTNPQLGLAQSATTDPSGLNLSSSSTYESPGSGSFLRQLSSTLPGGAGTNYTYWGATDTASNPCVQNSPSVLQAGMVHLKTDPNPNGTSGGRVTETIYDASGRVVATRYNTDPWTCTTYDSRGRVTQVAVPSINSQPARTITNNYLVGSNPLVTSSGDSTGTITTTIDLLGRTTSYTDAQGVTTTTSYDNLGRMSGRSGPLGTEGFTYNNYNQLTGQSLNSVTLASPTYDSYGRLSNVTYPTAGSLALAIGRDTLGRENSVTYTLGNGTTQLADSVSLSQSGKVTSGTDLGTTESYSYDKADRLTSATIGSNTYSYGFGTPTGCTGTYNSNAGADSNRTTQTINGSTTTYCYNYADQLISSSNPNLDAAQYDAHGNTTQLGNSANGGTVTQLGYDSSDRNSSITQGSTSVSYTRDVQSRVISRTLVNGSSTVNKYGFTGSGDTPDLLLDQSNNIVEKYESLPGGVLLTVRPNNTSPGNNVFSLPNVHGDVFATTDTNGSQTGTFQYDPFGTPINSSPNNTASGSTFSWEGQHQIDTEADFALSPTEMGARIYVASLGRFLQMDPVQGGTANNYVYPPDPVNDADVTGNFGWSTLTTIATIGSFIPGPIGIAFSAVAVVGNLAQHHYAEAGVAALGLVGAGVVGRLALKSVIGTKILTKVVSLQAKSPLIGANSKLFGMGKGLLNAGKYRVGWSSLEMKAGAARLAFRAGMPGAHNSLYSFPTRYIYQNVRKGIWR